MVKSLDNEFWKDIADYEGLYMVSNMGRIKSLKRANRKNDILLKITKEKDGYGIVSLCRDNVVKVCKVHRLVGVAFLENPDNKPQINHKLGNRLDNRASELEWSTSSENVVHSFKVLGKVSGYKGRIGSLAYNSKKVKCDTLGIESGSVVEISKILGVCKNSVSLVCNGNRKHAEGLSFRYL